MRQKIFAELVLGNDHIHIVSCEVSEGLSQVTHGVIEVASKTELPVAKLVGGEAQLVVVVDDIPVRKLTLTVGGGAFLRIDQGSLRYRIELFSPLWRLRHTRNLRKFRNMSSKDIVSQVLNESQIAHTWQIEREPPVRKYCVQYRESHFDFINRLLEFEGIYFQTQDDGSLHLRDVSMSAPFVAGEATFKLLDHGGALEGHIGIHQLRRGARVRTGKVTVNDYNWKTPAVSLLSSASDGMDSELESYDYPVGFRKPADGTALAKRRLEAHRVGSRYVSATTNVPFMQPGKRFTYAGEHGFSGELLITTVKHQVRDEAFNVTDEGAPEQTTYRNVLEAIPSQVPFRPPMSTSEPTVAGVHSARVRGPVGEEIHTDKYGRFRAQFHWDRESKSTDDDSRWLRKLQESATGANLARVGWEVSVAYINGDPDRPIGLARNINGVMTPTYGQPARKERMTIKTPSYPANGGYNELYMEDIAGAMMFDIRAQRDLQNFVRNDRTERIGNNDTRLIDTNYNRTVQGNQTISVGSDRTSNVGGGRQGKVEGTRADTVAGNETIKVGSQGSVSVNGSDIESVGSLRFTLAGSIAPPDIAGNAKALGKSTLKSLASGKLKSLASGKGAGAAGSVQGAADAITGGLSAGGVTALLTGNIGRSAETYFSRTVGGAKIAIAGNSIGHDAGYALIETVGGAKLTIAKGAIRQSVGGPCLFTVGGAVFRKSTGDMGVGSVKSRVMAGANISFKSDEKIEIHSKKIRLEALASLKIEGDGQSIELTPGAIAFNGPMVLQSDGDVSIAAPDDNISA